MTLYFFQYLSRIKLTIKRLPCSMLIMLKFDFHTHTIASGHAFNTVTELVTTAKKRGMSGLAITDHGPSMKGAPHSGYFEMVANLPKEIEGIKIFSGCEANILNLGGDIDLPPELQNQLDLVLAGLHKRTPFPKTSNINENTKAIIRALEKNKIDIIVHPYRIDFPTNIVEICKAAWRKGVVLEVNLSVLNKFRNSRKLIDEVRKMIRLAIDKDGLLTIGSDSHFSNTLGDDKILKELGIKIPNRILLGGTAGYKEIISFISSRKSI